MARHRPTDAPPIPRPEPQAGDPLYRQVVRAIEDGIRAGRFRVGHRLPAERRLADALGVSRTTVTGAYQELEARGLLRGHVGRGTVVVGTPPDMPREAFPWAQRASALALRAAPVSVTTARARTDTIAFESGWPDPELFPVEELETLLQALPGRDASELYVSAPPAGDPLLREAVARWLTSRGVRSEPDEVLVTAGALGGINVLARAFLSPGDVVLTESLTFQCALVAFRWAGAEVIGVAMDHDGVLPEPLEEAMVRYRPKLFYTIPTFHNPTGTVLSHERRRQVLELAARYRVPVIESNLYGELFFESPPPPHLKALDGGVVIHQGSFSKIVVPGLRVGWLVAPREAIPPLTVAKEFLDLHTPRLTQRLAAAFLDSAHMERHLAKLRVEARVRRDRLVAGLHEHCPDLELRVPAGGYYLWARLPAPVTTAELLPVAAEKGVTMRPEAQFSPGGVGREHVRLCFTALPPRAIAEGARRLGEALAETRRRLETPARRGPAAAASVV